MKEATAQGPVVAPEKMIRALNAQRIRNMAEMVGDPFQVVLEDHLDPLEVLREPKYWTALNAKQFNVGSRFELTNDAGSFLYVVYVRRMHGTAATGIRDIAFHHRVEWDERSGFDGAPVGGIPVGGTGRWEVRYGGRFKLWRCYSPDGKEIDTAFNDETSAVAYARQREGNPKAR